jgi:3-hydroxyacyl-[acyl-carrier-protein] dehydratase
MPPNFIFNITGLDLDQIKYGPEVIRECIPQRGDMEMLDAIVHVEEEQARLIGYKDIRLDQFWVPGHIPGRPLFPGVLMIEAGAQLASFYARKYLKWDGFVGFGGVNECRFRMEVRPPCRFYVLGERIWDRHRRICCNIQGVVEGNIVFEMQIIGVRM